MLHNQLHQDTQMQVNFRVCNGGMSIPKALMLVCLMKLAAIVFLQEYLPV